jgi:hypothetical protein
MIINDDKGFNFEVIVRQLYFGLIKACITGLELGMVDYAVKSKLEKEDKPEEDRLNFATGKL